MPASVEAAAAVDTLFVLIQQFSQYDIIIVLNVVVLVQSAPNISSTELQSLLDSQKVIKLLQADRSLAEPLIAKLACILSSFTRAIPLVEEGVTNICLSRDLDLIVR